MTSERRKDFSAAQLRLIRRSVARACTSEEFDEFIEVATLVGLDPMRRQIAPLIVNADDASRRRLIPWTTIDGLRVIAARHGDYRPMDAAPLIEYAADRIDENRNPLGIARAEVRAWKRYDGSWHAIVGEAWWDEFAPLRARGRGRAETPDEGAEQLEIDPSWRRMARVMIAKCAEAQALRRGWPELLSGLYGEEELHSLRRAEETASERLSKALKDEAARRFLNRTLWFIWRPGGACEPKRTSDIEAAVSTLYHTAQSADEIERFEADNRVSLATFWEWMPDAGYRLKVLREDRLRELWAQHAPENAGSASHNVTSVSADGAGAAHDA